MSRSRYGYHLTLVQIPQIPMKINEIEKSIEKRHELNSFIEHKLLISLYLSDEFHFTWWTRLCHHTTSPSPQVCAAFILISQYIWMKNFCKHTWKHKAHSKFVNKARNNVCLVEMENVFRLVKSESSDWRNKIDTLGKICFDLFIRTELFSM